MTPERWRQIRELFDQVIEQPAAARDSLLDQACAGDDELRREVASLIGSYDDSSTFIDQPAARLALDDALDPPQRIGIYRIIRPLDGGGMGDVFLARRDDDAYHQQVAIKRIKTGLATPSMVRRFRSERQILANLRHPAIAQLIDGGTTEQQQPYLVMEYIDGTPIDHYCDRNELSIAARLRLFRKVCDAVQFAHQNLVVHRDIKPGNILINAQGEPKLLDFGIAKLLRAEDFPEAVEATEPGQMAVTPEYASPEQLQGGLITTSSDVYSLGVLLYILLTGHRPFTLDRSKPLELIRRVTEEPPPKPSTAVTWRREVADRDGTVQRRTPDSISAARATDARRLRRRLAGDLDTIVLRALAKEPTRRYASAEQLAQDLDRCLAGLPVLARKDTPTYRVSKFVGRHRIAVAATAGVFVMLVALILALLIQRGEIVAQRDRYLGVSGFLLNMFAIPDPTRARGETVTARELLDRAAGEIEGQLTTAPEARADLLATMGRSYKNLGLYERAKTQLATALELHRQVHGENHPAVATSLHELADVLLLAGDYSASRQLETESLAIRERLYGSEHPEVVESLYHLALADGRLGELETADSLFSRALVTVRQLDQPALLAKVLDGYANLLGKRAEYTQAEGMLHEASEIYRSLYGDVHPDSALNRNNLAVLYETQGDYETAERLYREAESMQRRLFEGPHSHLATTLNNLALVLRKRGRLDEARVLYDEALAMRVAVYDSEHPALAATKMNIADLLYARGQAEEAETLLVEALAMRRRLLGDRHADTATSLDRLAQILVDKGEVDRAEAMYQEALAITTELLGDSHPRVGNRLNNLADLAFTRGRLEEAEALYRQALAIHRQALGEQHPTVASILYNLATLQRAQSDLDAADATFDAAVQIGRTALGEGHPEVALVKTGWAELKNRLGDYPTAERLAREALLVLEQEFSSDHPWVIAARGYLAESLRQQGRLDSR
ncbi:MAG: serine/threonine-protein kinase [Acidobacteriota bacterium]